MITGGGHYWSLEDEQILPASSHSTSVRPATCHNKMGTVRVSKMLTSARICDLAVYAVTFEVGRSSIARGVDILGSRGKF